MEKAILVGCQLPHQDSRQTESSLHELSLLAETADTQVVCTVMQRRQHLDPAYYIGSGKIEEVARLAKHYAVDLVIFNTELSASQVYNLERIIPCKVIDRTQLILDIFSRRARSKEGQLQVELAQLNYLLPRIMGKGTFLSRLGGGIGTRGPGETKLELDRRHIYRRIRDIKRELARITIHRDRYRQRRRKRNLFQVALVGYTNAGKSTLLNGLTKAESYTEDQPFATLDPLTKQMRLPSGYTVLITDTVGFIQDLPTTLIAAFRSTLEEVNEADLILHVVDSHDEQHPNQIEVVEALLNQLEAGQIPLIRVYNKRDLTPAPNLVVSKDDLYISAKDKGDCERVKVHIEAALKEQVMQRYDLLLPAEKAGLIPRLRHIGLIDQLEWDEHQHVYRLQVYLPPHAHIDEELQPLFH